jgi:hypothetical protein
LYAAIVRPVTPAVVFNRNVAAVIEHPLPRLGSAKWTSGRRALPPSDFTFIVVYVPYLFAAPSYLT